MKKVSKIFLSVAMILMLSISFLLVGCTKDSDSDSDSDFESDSFEEKSQYCLDSIELYIQDYENITAERVEICGVDIGVSRTTAFEAKPIGGLDPFSIEMYKGIPLYNSGTFKNDTNYSLKIYTEKNDYNIFEENETILFYIVYSRAMIVNVELGKTFYGDKSYSIDVTSSSVTETLEDNEEYGYKVMVKFNFAEIQK